MFVVLVGAVWTSAITIAHFSSFNLQISLWLWFTLLFANFAEAMAEGRGKAQAAALRQMRTTIIARRLRNGSEEKVAASELAGKTLSGKRSTESDVGKKTSEGRSSMVKWRMPPKRFRCSHPTRK